ncbi:Dam family site-specific DNA-(adenine-N6)-methyltransferase [Rhizobium rhizogenes]|uniref:Site-specific DNA-methyltransferase (adenine-specific) n=1 Tax=Rhizobium rhizogenes TaxID=359 RepID=A0AA88EW07_RHIRH|nr:Dam family site-specific DNA-(adenine-N6)-methyltransferase [Rhizobium rhizogenes]KAA3498386.1 Dam family site-specific DNA-(adenine-N6)-methyltransferase [Rhizobium rhizogenes]
MKPFIKWAGGKRWLINDPGFGFPEYSGRYIEPFLGGGAVFFHLAPPEAILSDVNERLISTYKSIRDEWRLVQASLFEFQEQHSKEFYYEERSREHTSSHLRAAQFLYLNRTCFNGLYRENLKGQFNVPLGTKTQVTLSDDDFELASKLLSRADLRAGDFEDVVSEAMEGDLVFLDPPYTTAHNLNGFIKYNQKIFTWDDQKRLMEAIREAIIRGARVILTNANHESIHELYFKLGTPKVVSRPSVISGSVSSRRATTEALFIF